MPDPTVFTPTLCLLLLFVAWCGYRVAHVFTTDSLIEGWRARAEDWAYLPPAPGGDRDYKPVLTKDGVVRYRLTVLRGKLVDLWTCPHCLGVHTMWVQLCVLTRSWPWQLGWVGWCGVGAAAGVQSFLTSVDGR